MLVRCPQCRTEIRLTEFSTDERVVRYLCARCAEIVRIDLLLDEVKSSTASSSFRQVRRQQVVLVADDDTATRRVAAEILCEAGHKVLLATDGDEALEVVESDHPDVVVTGLMTRGLTAYDLLRRMRSQERVADTPVLIMSSVSKPEMVRRLVELGAAGFIDRERLVETLAFRVQTVLEERAEPGVGDDGSGAGA